MSFKSLGQVDYSQHAPIRPNTHPAAGTYQTTTITLHSCLYALISMCNPLTILYVCFAVGETSSRSGYVLVALVVPAHLVFMNLISLAKNGTPITNVGFITLFCMAALLQVKIHCVAKRLQ